VAIGVDPLRFAQKIEFHGRKFHHAFLSAMQNCVASAADCGEASCRSFCASLNGDTVGPLDDRCGYVSSTALEKGVAAIRSPSVTAGKIVDLRNMF